MQPRRGSIGAGDTEPILSPDHDLSDDSSSSYSNTDLIALTRADVTKPPDIASKSYGTREP